MSEMITTPTRVSTNLMTAIEEIQTDLAETPPGPSVLQGDSAPEGNGEDSGPHHQTIPEKMDLDDLEEGGRKGGEED